MDEMEKPAPEENEVLGLVANRTNRSVLAFLAIEPSYPRRIASVLGLAETEVARRLRQLENLGLVEGAWQRVEGADGGKNVKSYKLALDQLSIHFRSQGIQIQVRKGEEARTTQLPNAVLEPVPTLEGFVGRAKELKELESAPVVIVEGLPGIGKTSLLAAYAREASQRRPVYWHSFRGLESSGWLLNQLALYLAQQGDRSLMDLERTTDPNDRRELCLQRLNDAKYMFAFDEVHRIEDPTLRTFIQEAIERLNKPKLLVGCRERPRFGQGLPHVRIVKLGGLTDADVDRILVSRGHTLPPNLLPKVREEVGGHPVALNLLLEANREMGGKLEALLDRVPERQVQEWLLQEVHGGLSDNERQLLSHASLFRGAFRPEELAAVSGKNQESTLLALRRRHLVETDGNWYHLHEVVRNFFYAMLHDRPALHQKVAHIYQTQQTHSSRLEAMYHYLQASRRDKVLELVEKDLDLGDFDYIDAGYQALYLSILNLFQRKDVPNAKQWALLEDERGDVMMHQGDAKAALPHYDAALAIFKGKDPPREADLGWKRGLALEKLGRPAEARDAIAAGLATKPTGAAKERLEAVRSRLGSNEPKATLTAKAVPKKRRA